MSNKTAWSKSSSSFPSDRIKPVHPQPQSSGKRKGKGKAGHGTPPNEPAGSKAVVQLETLLKYVREYSGQDKDPKGGCFCQARKHALSTYTPICRTCGLILCEINPPYMACPHCGTALLPTDSTKHAVISRLETQIAETIRKEAEDKQKAEEEARRTAGAFPTLSNMASSATIAATTISLPGTLLRASTNEPRKVISLNSKTKKVTVSAFVPSPSVSRPASRSSVENVDEDEVKRVPPPSSEVTHAKRKLDGSRPWVNLGLVEPISYVPAPPKAISQAHQSDGKRRGKNKQDQLSTSAPGS